MKLTKSGFVSKTAPSEQSNKFSSISSAQFQLGLCFMRYKEEGAIQKEQNVIKCMSVYTQHSSLVVCGQHDSSVF